MKEIMQMYIEVCEGFGNMEVIKIYANEKFASCTPAVACIGYFDGIHVGHQKLIDTVKTYANTHDCVPSCICFDCDPWILLHKESNPAQLTPLHKRLELFEKFGIKRCYLLHFDKDMMQMPALAFIENILEKCNLKALICGSDFRFAHKGEGNIETLKKAQFESIVVDPIMYDKDKISSSIIEKHIYDGNIALANTQLGYIYNVDGIVVDGNKIGSKIGFPTANIKIDHAYVIPKKGVYKGKIKIDSNMYRAMINIGHNPTLNEVANISIEAHIVSFNKDIYGKHVDVYFEEYLREERKFESAEALIEQLHKDLNKIRKG